ncbi:hypothetical protein DSTSK_36020 [Desulforhabdus sp. TSK]|nr:hypothetical protein DSTSK_36020 [Desulforhabdus sp. TSK]
MHGAAIMAYIQRVSHFTALKLVHGMHPTLLIRTGSELKHLSTQAKVF